MTIRKPPRLKRGDLIGVIAPASAPSSTEKVEKGVLYLESLGYRVRVGKNATRVHGFFAGTDEERAADLNDMLNDSSVKAIFAVRGGYGTPRLLRHVDYAAARQQPKIIVGYSDLTSLQLALLKKCGLVTFSGPMVGVEMWDSIDPYTEEHFWRILTSNKKIGPLVNPPDEPLRPLRKGRASGRVIGGNLALFLANYGTPFFPDVKGAILVLEDVDEAPHRVDRMIIQLVNSGLTTKISAIVLGKFTECEPSDTSSPHFTVDQVLDGISDLIPVPVVRNFQYGHIPKKLTVPFGVRARLDVEKRRFEILEGAVS